MRVRMARWPPRGPARPGRRPPPPGGRRAVDWADLFAAATSYRAALADFDRVAGNPSALPDDAWELRRLPPQHGPARPGDRPARACPGPSRCVPGGPHAARPRLPVGPQICVVRRPLPPGHGRPPDPRSAAMTRPPVVRPRRNGRRRSWPRSPAQGGRGPEPPGRRPRRPRPGPRRPGLAGRVAGRVGPRPRGRADAAHLESILLGRADARPLGAYRDTLALAGEAREAETSEVRGGPRPRPCPRVGRGEVRRAACWPAALAEDLAGRGMAALSRCGRRAGPATAPDSVAHGRPRFRRVPAVPRLPLVADLSFPADPFCPLRSARLAGTHGP